MAEDSRTSAARDFIRDEVRRMQGLGMPPQDILAYVSISGAQAGLPNLTVHELVKTGRVEHPETLPSQALGEAATLPLSGMRQAEEQRLTVPEGDPREFPEFAAMTGATLGVEALTPVPPAMGKPAMALGRRLFGVGKEMGAASFGATAGYSLGDIYTAKMKGQPLDLMDTGVQALRRGGLEALGIGALRGVGEIYGFLRGGAATDIAKKGMEFARQTEVEGAPLPARARDFAPRTLAGLLDRGAAMVSAGTLKAMKNQGQKVAQYLDEQLRSLGPGHTVESPNIAVENAASLLRNTSGRNAQRFGEGIGKNFENSEIWLDKFFTPANSHLIKGLREGNPDQFNELVGAWLQKTYRQFSSQSDTGGFSVVDGPRLRQWFEGHEKFIRKELGKEQADALDGLTAYAQFASVGAKRAYGPTQLRDFGPAAFEGAVLGLLVPSGVADWQLGFLGLAGWEAAMLALFKEMGNPKSPVFKLFSEGINRAPIASRVGGAMLGADKGLFRLPPGSPQVFREQRPRDTRFEPPVFRGMDRSGKP